MSELSKACVKTQAANAYPATQMAAFLRRRKRELPALAWAEGCHLRELSKDAYPEFWHQAGDEKYGLPEYQATFNAWKTLEAFGDAVDGCQLNAELSLFVIDPAGVRVVWDSRTPRCIVRYYAPVFDHALKRTSRGTLTATHFQRPIEPRGL
jgi:hypothetical protein